jgi:hypothetical protein
MEQALAGHLAFPVERVRHDDGLARFGLRDIQRRFVG